MPPHASHLLQPLDVGCFAVVKRAYGRFVSDLVRQGYNHIDKIDFLMDYQHARLEAFQKPSTIQNSFAAAGSVPIDAERVLSKLNISLRTPTPPGSRISRLSLLWKLSRLEREDPKLAFQAARIVGLYRRL
jgi:hypothetical protein